MIPGWLTPQLRLTLSALGIAQIVNWGVLYYTLALIGPHIHEETGWSESFVYSGFAVATVVTGLLAPLSGQAIDRLGGGPVMLTGTLLGAFGMALLSFSHDWTLYLAAWAVIGAGMSACLYDSAFAAIARLAGTATRQSISLVTLIAGFASTVSWPATYFLLRFFNWREVALIDAGLMISISLPCLYIGLKAPAVADHSSVLEKDRTTTPAVNYLQPMIPETLFPLAMTLFSIVITALGFVANALSVHVITLFQRLEIDPGSAILAGVLIGPAQVGARVLELVFGRRLSAIGLGLVPVILMPVAFAIPLVLGSHAMVAVFFGLVYGAANGLATIARGVVPYALFGPAGYGRRLGLMSAPALLVKATAPAIFASMLALYGPLGAVLFALAVSLCATAAMLCLGWLVNRNR